MQEWRGVACHGVMGHSPSCAATEDHVWVYDHGIAVTHITTRDQVDVPGLGSCLELCRGLRFVQS